MSGPATQRLIHQAGNPSATVELSGVDAEGFMAPGDCFDALVAAVWIEQPARDVARIRIDLAKSSASVRSFALSQLPGVVVDITEAASQIALPLMDGLGSASHLDGAGESLPWESAMALPGIASAQLSPMALPQSAAGGSFMPEEMPVSPGSHAALPAETIFADVPQEPEESAPQAGQLGPGLFPENFGRFPLPLVQARSEAGQAIQALFEERRYEQVVKRSWDFFAQQASQAERPDEIGVLAMAAEARYQFEVLRGQPRMDSPLNYYRQLRRVAASQALQAFASYRIAQCCRQQHALEQAAVALEEAAAPGILPFTRELQVELAELLLEMGRGERAAQILAGQQGTDPKPLEQAYALYLQGRAQAERRQWEEAAASYQGALDTEPLICEHHPEMLFDMGRCALALGSWNEAGDLYERFLRRGKRVLNEMPADWADEIRFDLARYAARNGASSPAPTLKPDFALKTLRDIEQRHAGRLLGRRAELELARLGLVDQAAGRMREPWMGIFAYREPVQAMKLLSESATSPELATELCYDLIRLVREDLARGQSDDVAGNFYNLLNLAAFRAYQGVFQNRGEAGDLLAEVLDLMWQEKQYLEGVRLLAQAGAVLSPESLPARARYYGALCHLGIHSASGAVPLLTALEGMALDFVPDDVVQLHLAEAEAMVARSRGLTADEACGRLERLLRQHPDSPIRGAILLQLGMLQESDAQYGQAIQSLQKALAHPSLDEAQQISALLALGEAHAGLGQFSQALNAYVRGMYGLESRRAPLEQSAEAQWLLYGMAHCLYELSNWPKAALMFEQFLVFYPDHGLAPACRYFLADCRSRLGDREGADSLFAQVEADPRAQTYWRELAGQARIGESILMARERIGLDSTSMALE